ncbi:Hint domain-containing protein [Actinomadura nitritigenes]|uniref:Hint domain-containing protein n=1 Tax=Actinomadura nitritigenes TaxID=134602 RepID=UPI003D8D0473
MTVSNRLAQRDDKSFTYASLETDPVSDGDATYSRDPSGSLLATGQGLIKRLDITDRHGDLDPADTDPTALSDSTAYSPFGEVTATTTSKVGNLGFSGRLHRPRHPAGRHGRPLVQPGRRHLPCPAAGAARPSTKSPTSSTTTLSSRSTTTSSNRSGTTSSSPSTTLRNESSTPRRNELCRADGRRRSGLRLDRRYGLSLSAALIAGGVSSIASSATKQLLDTSSVNTGRVVTAGLVGAATAGITHGAARGLGGTYSSFALNTPVLMADGTRKAIQNVRKGDKVLAADPTTGKTTARPLVDTIVATGTKHLVQITVDTDGKRGSKTGMVVAKRTS